MPTSFFFQLLLLLFFSFGSADQRNVRPVACGSARGSRRLRYVVGDALTDRADCVGPNGEPYPTSVSNETSFLAKAHFYLKTNTFLTVLILNPQEGDRNPVAAVGRGQQVLPGQQKRRKDLVHEAAKEAPGRSSLHQTKVAQVVSTAQSPGIRRRSLSESQERR